MNPYRIWLETKTLKVGTKVAADGEWHSFNKDGTERATVKVGIVYYESGANASWSLLAGRYMVSVRIRRKDALPKVPE